MRVFLLEDNADDAEYFKGCMEDRSHEVTHFERAVPLLDALHHDRPGMVVLDSHVPEIDGPTALKQIRTLCGTALPVAMLSCIGDNGEVVDVLNAGADDYLIKPMTQPVLVARLEALMRRGGTGGERPNRVLEIGPYRLDFLAREVALDGVAVTLTPKEFDLAWVLFERINRFIPRAELILGVWGRHAELATHTITQHIYVVRNKLAFRDNGFSLSAVYGSGYRFEAPRGMRVEREPTQLDS
jgi:two-component system, OmpR family, response regulator RegX3